MVAQCNTTELYTLKEANLWYANYTIIFKKSFIYTNISKL